MTTLKRAWAFVTRHRPYTAYLRFSEANGNLLASGVAYYSFFSVFPAIALAFTVFGFVLQGRPDLIVAISNQLNTLIPNMVKTAANPTGFIGVSAPTTTALTVTGISAFVILLLAGLGWIGALRTGIRSVFGLDAATGNAVLTKLRDLAVLGALGVGIAVSAAVSSVAGGLTTQVAGAVGLGEAAWLVTVVGLLLGIVFDGGLMVLMIRVLSGVPLPWHNVRDGALFGAVLLGALKIFGSALIANATKSPLLGAVAVAVGLLFWLNLMARVILLSAAWAATHVDIAELVHESDHESDHETSEEEATAGRSSVTPGAPWAPSASISRLDGRSEAGAPAPASVRGVAASRRGDRVSLAAGVTIGAVGAALMSGLVSRRWRWRGR